MRSASTVALRRGCSRSASATARTMRSVMVGAPSHCCFSCARSATAASIDTSVPRVSCAISVQALVHPRRDDATHARERDDLERRTRLGRLRRGRRHASARRRAARDHPGRSARPSRGRRPPPRRRGARAASRPTAAASRQQPSTGASSTSAVTMRPFGPVPRRVVTSMPRSPATRRAFGETNRRPSTPWPPARCGSGDAAAGAAAAGGGVGDGSDGAGAVAGGQLLALGEQPADQRAGRQVGALRHDRVEQPLALGLDVDVDLVGRQAHHRVADLDRRAGGDEPLLDQPGLHRETELRDENLLRHVRPRDARAAPARPRRCAARRGCRPSRAPD